MDVREKTSSKNRLIDANAGNIVLGMMKDGADNEP